MKKIIPLTILLLICLAISLNSSGQTWQKLNLPSSGNTFVDMVVGADGNIYALAGEKRKNQGYGMYTSSDNGDSWTLFDSSARGSEILTVSKNGVVFMDNDLTTTKTDGQTLDFIDFYTYGQKQSSAAMVCAASGTLIEANGNPDYRRSIDSGASFTDVAITNVLAPLVIDHRTLFTNDNGDIYYLGTDKAMYRSTDDGLSYSSAGTVIPLESNSRSLCIDAKTGAFYNLEKVVANTKITKSTDHGATWTDVKPTGLFVNQIVAYDDQIVAYNNQSIFYSNDGGANWTDESAIFTLAEIPEDFLITPNGTVLGRNAFGYACVKVDFANDTYEPKTDGIQFTQASGISYNNGRLAATLNSYAHYTDDNGASWTRLKGEAANTSRVYVANDKTVYTVASKYGTWAGVYKQEGDSLIKVNADTAEVWNMLSMFEDDQGNIYCLSNLNGLYKSANGIDFTLLRNAPFEILNEQTMWFSDSLKRIYSIQKSSQTIHFSDDYGVSWTEGTPVQGLTWGNYNHFKGHGEMWVYAWSATAGQTGYYRSSDLLNWTGPFETSGSFDGRWSQAVKGLDDGRMYHAFNQTSILTSSDTGKTWTDFMEGLDKVKLYTVNGTYDYRVPYTKLIGNGDKLVLSTNGSIYTYGSTSTPTSAKPREQIITRTVYPNPTANAINIAGTQGVYSVQLTDIQGVLIFEKTLTNPRMSLQDLQNGIYTLVVKDALGVSFHKIILTH